MVTIGTITGAIAVVAVDGGLEVQALQTTLMNRSNSHSKRKSC